MRGQNESKTRFYKKGLRSKTREKFLKIFLAL